MGFLDDFSYFLVSTYYYSKAFFFYRLQSVFYLMQNFITVIVTLVSVSVVYSISSGFAGWSYYQMLFLTNLSGLTFGIVAFIANPGALPRTLREGKLDAYMVRPYGAFTLILANTGAASALFSTILGSILILAYVALQLQLTATSLLLFIPLYFAGVAAFVIFLETLGVLSYHLVRSGTYMKEGLKSLTTLAKYPFSIYSFPIQLAFTLLVPVGIAYYYPSQAFFGRIGLPLYLAFLSAAMALVFIFYLAFRYLMRFYESGGG
jgi:ABC-2 type transport system permease protein